MRRPLFFGMRAGLQTLPARSPDGIHDGSAAAPAEMALLREAVRCALPGVSAAAPVPIEAVDWPRVLWHGRAQRVLFFLRERLASLEPAQRPADVWAQLTQLYEVNQFRVMERGRELCLIQDLLEKAGVSAIAMNGWAFGQRYYPNPALRDVGATTAFLIDPADRGRAESALGAAGYAFGADPLRLLRTRHSHVVLHTRLDGGEGVGGVPLAQIRARAESFAVGGRTLAVLSARDWIFRFCGQAARSLEASLRLSFDLGVLVLRQPGFDWTELLEEARRAGIESSVLLGLAVSREVLGVALPEPVRAQLERAPDVERRARLLAGALEHPAGNRWRRLRARVALQTTWSGKLGVVSRAVRSALRRAPQPEPKKELAYIGRFSPTPMPVVMAMLRFAGAGPDDVVWDLGCGDGRVVIAAAKQFGARGIGIDIDPQRIASAQKAAAAAGVADRVTLSCADVLQTPLTGATIVCIYLQGFAYPVLRKKLESELPRGTRVVSHNFVFPGWPPEKTEIVRSDRFAASHIYLWRI